MKTSWRRLEDIIARRLENVLKMSCKTSWRRLEDVLGRRIGKWRRKFLLWRRLEDVLKTSWKTRNDCWEVSWTTFVVKLAVSTKITNHKPVYKCIITNINSYISPIIFQFHNMFTTQFRFRRMKCPSSMNVLTGIMFTTYNANRICNCWTRRCTRILAHRWT